MRAVPASSWPGAARSFHRCWRAGRASHEEAEARIPAPSLSPVFGAAPRGLGGLTNELAAFPSLHAGWSLWVALALQLYATRHWVRVLGWLYALGTAFVIVGTGNHWVIDAIVGWMVILVGWALAEAVGHLPVRRALDRLLPFESPFTRVDPGEIPTEQAATTPASQESRPAPQ